MSAIGDMHISGADACYSPPLPLLGGVHKIDMYVCGNEKMSDCFQGFCMEMTIEIVRGVVITSRQINAYKTPVYMPL